MTTKELLDPELTAMAEGPFLPQLTDETIADIRRVMADQAPELHDPSSKSVYRKEIFVSVNGQPDVRCLLYGKLNGQEDASGYLHIHGGGYLFGSPEGSDPMNLHLASILNIVILSVDYRLAPENPIPAPLDDCYAALGGSTKTPRNWVWTQSESAWEVRALAVGLLLHWLSRLVMKGSTVSAGNN